MSDDTDDANSIAKKYGAPGLRKVFDGADNPPPKPPPALAWQGVNQDGRPKANCPNTCVAINRLGVNCRYDEFHDRLLVHGDAIEQYSGELTDHACYVLRTVINQEFGFDPGRNHIFDAAVQLCLQSRFDPVCDYLDGLRWDRRNRIDNWLSTYLSASDTPLNRAIAKLGLVAAVRRARKPGCKFDQIIVFEGVEGTMKSTALLVLAGDDNFSDQTILGMKDQEQQERLRGRWLYEIADLSGMNRSDVEHIKAFASRTHDRARPAYGRCLIEQPRRCIMFATTNSDAYLRSPTGNRRFWPVKTGAIDIAALCRDRDQLWAEAAFVERTGVSLELPLQLWPDARVEQDKRLEHDPWEDFLIEVKGAVFQDEERIASKELLKDHLKMTADKAGWNAENRLKVVMIRLGWEGPVLIYLGGKRVRGYRRSVPSVPHSVP